MYRRTVLINILSCLSVLFLLVYPALSGMQRSSALTADTPYEPNGRHLLRAVWPTPREATSMGDTRASLLPQVSPDKKPGTIRFIAYGDTRDGHAIHRKLVALIMKLKPDFVIQTGDLVNSATNPADWKTYDGITLDMRKAIPVYPTRGNHDVGGDFYEKRFTSPISSGNRLYYTLDKGSIHYIGLDNYSPLAPDSEQYKWLEKDLAHAQKRANHIFVAFHVPPYGIGWHGSDLEVRKILCPLFTKYGVRAVFNGHDHNYYRTLRNGVTYITTGGGGATPFPPDPSKGAISGDKYALAFHIVVCDVVGDEVKFTALRVDNKSFDSFTLSSLHK